MNKSVTSVYPSHEMVDTTTWDEAAVLGDACLGDRHAFGVLVRQYQRQAYAIAYSFVGNREDALELAQESFARAYKAMDRFDSSLPFYPWLYRIIKNTCLNHLKKRNRRGEVSLEGMQETGFDVASATEAPDNSMHRLELKAQLAEALTTLPEDHREILVLRHFQELSYREIAECLGIPQGTVMSRLHAARKNLRSRLERDPDGKVLME
jgi:RNA polymerase sigma-70 factor (ECF subfamily)